MVDATHWTKAEIAFLRERAATIRRLSRQYEEADPKIAEKLLSVAVELEAKADALDGPFTPH